MASKNTVNAVSSDSWISRAGVVLGYEPEDTMKSLIFNENNKHCIRMNNADFGNIVGLPQSDIDRALELLSSDDDSDSSSITKDTIKNGCHDSGFTTAHLFDLNNMPLNESEKNCTESANNNSYADQRLPSACSSAENESTIADLSSDLEESEFCKDVITASNISFEEILEKKLLQEKLNKNEKINNKTEGGSKPKFTFLRKNSGKAAWSSNVKGNVKKTETRSHSSDRETTKADFTNDGKTGLRRMKSMPSTSIKSLPIKKNSDERQNKNALKTVHFADRSDHETSNETLDTVKSFKNDQVKKIQNIEKPLAIKSSCDINTSEEMDKELVEFELLEQIANVSMSSTASSIARFDEDMLRERVMRIQKMPPPKSLSQNKYYDDKRLSGKDVILTSIGHSKLPTCTGIIEELHTNTAYDSEPEGDSISSCSHSTTLSKFQENTISQHESFAYSNPLKSNPIRKISKQDDRHRTNYLDKYDNDDSWIEESPFQMATKKPEIIEQVPKNTVQVVPQTNWNFADPFHQSDASSDEEKYKSDHDSHQPDHIELGNIFPNVVLDKKQANPDDNISVQSAKLKQWVQLLEAEIKRFNKENEEISKIKSEHEQGLKRLENEMNDFSKHKDEESKQFEDFKQKEIKKLKKERKIFEEYQEAMKNMPNKKDREEIENLKMEIQILKDDAANKESRWQAANSRLKMKIEQLETENSEMHSRIHLLEQKRLQLQAQLISHNQTANKPSELNNTKHKQNVTSVSQAISMKHTNNPITSVIKDDNNNNKFINSQKSTMQNKKTSTKIPNPTSKVSKGTKRPNQASTDNGRVDVRGSAASDYYTGEDESGSTDSHINGHSLGSTVRDNPDINSDIVTITSSPYSVKMNRSNDSVKDEIRHQDGILERVYVSGAVDVVYPNGSLKQISSDGKSIVIHLFNGDVKQMMPDGRVVYFYSQDESVQTTFPDGREEISYKNGQSEIVHPGGIREVHFPDQSIKIVHPDSREENILPNGLIIRLNGAGDKEILLPNGQKEIHANGIKKRIYPDGTTKTVYGDGRQETYYASGRMRVKDRNGVLILDRYIDQAVPANPRDLP